MSWDVRSVYYYLVCFATLLMLVFGSVNIVNHALNLILPPPTYSPSAIDLYERMRVRPVNPDQPGTAATSDTLSAETVERMAEEERVRMEKMQLRNDVRSLLHSLALVLIAGPLYIYHWRRVRGPSERKAES
ncbi:MAG TPA: hypothetical protein VF190_00690 [Rhodothermales bacterium]